MFIAHLPAGYLVARRMARHSPCRRWIILTGLIAAVLPDLDVFWFYLASDRQSVHHDYPTHWPLVWVAMAALALTVTRLTRRHAAEPLIWVALACVLSHMVLDSIAAGIGWLQPFSDRELNAVAVPARYDWWVWSFVLHWTFMVELVIAAVAGWVALQDLRPKRGRR